MSKDMKTDPHIRVGPAGWSYQDWKGIVYPPGMRRQPLEWLSSVFDTVEVNTTFYRPPDPFQCASWVDRVRTNERFRFAVKLWLRFTHQREEQFTGEEVRLVQDGLKPFLDAGRLGAVLVQFPWSFKRTPENRRWLSEVLDAFADFPLVLEVRHGSWNRPEVFEALGERNVAFCNIDQPLFPDSLGPTAISTARIGYVRLHGRNVEDWFREDASTNDRYNYLYSEEELRPWLAKIERLRGQVDEVFVITNNHYRGQAVVNAFELEYGLGERGLTLPASLLRHYPRLGRLLGEGAAAAVNGTESP